MTNIRLPRLMDRQLQEICRLRPDALAITHSLTPLSTAEMTLPPDQPAVQVGYFIELYDLAGSAGIFRVASVENTIGEKPKRKVTLEHALVTLSDHIVFGYTEIGGAEVTTSQVIAQLLARQSTWQLGECDVDFQYAYSFENENLLTALLSVTGPIAQPTMWRFDFSTQPWTLHLKLLSQTPACECRAGRSLQNAQITIDRTDLCTRLYPLGYGEGIDQLRVGSLTGGTDYLEADTLSVWGEAEMVYTERSITDAATLLAAAKTVLDRVKNPVVTAQVEASDLAHLTGEPLDRFALGEIIRLPLHDWGVSMDERIITLRRPDVYGDPTLVRLTLANRALTAVDDLARLARRSAISEIYSQGAASEYAVHFGDNCDEDHPAELKFYIDRDAVHVNKVEVQFDIERFRGYSKGAASGGSLTATAENGGEATITQAQRIVSTEASTGVPIAGRDGATTGNTGFAIGTNGSTMSSTGTRSASIGASSLLTTDSSSSAVVTGEAGDHSHSGPSHSHSFSGSTSLAWGHTHVLGSSETSTGGVNNYAAKSVEISGSTGSAGGGSTSSAGAHSHSMAAHTHGMQHTHTSPAHSHDMGHYHNFSHMHGVTVSLTIPEMELAIPPHTHEVKISSHRHSPELGIYESSTRATQVTVMVDGTAVPAHITQGGEFDAASYLLKDSDGRIRRGRWHTITFTPNAPARVVADVHVRTFIRSLSGALL